MKDLDERQTLAKLEAEFTTWKSGLSGEEKTTTEYMHALDEWIERLGLARYRAAMQTRRDRGY